MRKSRTKKLTVVEHVEDIPRFASEDDEARYWSEHELGDEMLDAMTPLGEEVLPPARARTRPVSVRIDEDVLQRLRVVAAHRGKRYQTLLKQFVLERLYEEERREGIVPSVGRVRHRLRYRSARAAEGVSRPRNGRARKGSQWNIQEYVNWGARELNDVVRNEVAQLRKADLEWVSPLARDGFKEYRDADFLSRVGLATHAESLADFWPVRGPLWDALAIVGRGGNDRPGVLLVEAKSYTSEMHGRGSRAKAQASVKKIQSALEQTCRWLGVSAVPDSWTGPLYQHANRLAHLYWLNEIAGVDAWLVFCLFADDRTHRATTRRDWVEAISNTTRELGLEGIAVPRLHHVVLTALPTESQRSHLPARAG
jgi:uncharacterized protein (DUF4415 family)